MVYYIGTTRVDTITSENLFDAGRQAKLFFGEKVKVKLRTQDDNDI